MQIAIPPPPPPPPPVKLPYITLLCKTIWCELKVYCKGWMKAVFILFLNPHIRVLGILKRNKNKNTIVKQLTKHSHFQNVEINLSI